MIQLIPLPKKVSQLTGTFRLTQDTSCYFAPELQETFHFFKDLVEKAARFPLQKGNEMADIRFLYDTRIPEEGYQLDCTQSGIAVFSSTPAGAFYAVQTLRQLLKLDVSKNAETLSMACVKIEDAPRFRWRGMMLDSSRYFWSVDYVKRYLDFMAMHKLNVFHWHLTDDAGWRIEIKKYPLLTQIGSRRAETLVGRYDKNKEGVYDGKPYGGFYTQEEIREIVSYAAERHIEVIPEIEMPGHGLAALTAYPWLGCTGGPYAVWTHWGISDDVYCAGKETTFEFIEKVLTEVLALFPSKLIHIGGDECPKGRWKACPLCQQRIREEGLKDEYQLQSYFIHRIERWMHTHGREIIGWDEILQGGISKTANIMSWNGSDPGIKAAQRGNPVIMTPKWYCYFDYSQTSDPERYEPLGNTRYVSVRQAYRLDPCDRLTLPDQKRIRGVQCNLWTEYIADIRHALHMVLPRMAALAETGWANDRKDYNDFVRRIPALVAVYKAEGYNYAPYLFEGIE